MKKDQRAFSIIVVGKEKHLLNVTFAAKQTMYRLTCLMRILVMMLQNRVLLSISLKNIPNIATDAKNVTSHIVQKQM